MNHVLEAALVDVNLVRRALRVEPIDHMKGGTHEPRSCPIARTIMSGLPTRLVIGVWPSFFGVTKELSLDIAEGGYAKSSCAYESPLEGILAHQVPGLRDPVYFKAPRSFSTFIYRFDAGDFPELERVKNDSRY